MAESNTHDIQQLTTKAVFKQRDSGVFVNNIKWHHTKSQLLMVDPAFLTIWSLNEADTEILGNVDLTSSSSENVKDSIQARKGDYIGSSACWDPHVSSSCAVATHDNVCIIDTRSFDVSTTISRAHRGNVRDVDYNSNKSNTIITGGDDRLIKIWDLRSTSEPLKVMSGHSHWVSKCLLVCLYKFPPHFITIYRCCVSFFLSSSLVPPIDTISEPSNTSSSRYFSKF